MQLGFQTFSATQLSSPERQGKPLTSDGQISRSDRPPLWRHASSAPFHSSRSPARPRPAHGGGAPPRPPAAASRWDAEPPCRKRPAWRARKGAELTRPTCLEPADRQQQTAAAAQRHGEPVPATASGNGHLPSAQGRLGAAISVRPALPPEVGPARS